VRNLQQSADKNTAFQHLASADSRPLDSVWLRLYFVGQPDGWQRAVKAVLDCID